MSIENFTGKAEAYVKGRPGYPEAAIEYIESLVMRDAVFADIGAGTGKFTQKLAERGCAVYAVEPNGDMRRQLSRLLSPFKNVRIVDGTAEATTLSAYGVDAVTVAHALHWFEPAAFRAECRRILKPGGWVIAVYNLTPGGGMQSLSRRTAAAFFTKPEVFECPNPMDYTRDSWLAYLASQDDSPAADSPGYDGHIAAVNAAFDRESVNGLLRCERVTKVYAERME